MSSTSAEPRPPCTPPPPAPVAAAALAVLCAAWFLTSFSAPASGDFAEPFPGGPGQGVPGAVGVAVVIGDNGRPVIQSVVDGFPAAEAGVAPGDEILKVDGISLRGATLEQALVRLRGFAGVPARLTLSRKGRPRPLEIALVRAELAEVVAEQQLTQP